MKKILVFFCVLFLCTSLVFAEKIKTAGDDVSQISIIRRYKDINYNWRALNKMKNQTKNLSENDKAIIKKYIFGAVRGEDTYLLINCDLRGNLEKFIPKKEVTKPLMCRLDYYADQLSVPISKIKLPQNTILYRGVDDKGIKLMFAEKNIDSYVTKPVTEENLKFVKQKLVGTKFEEKGFMSTSYDINCAKQTKFMFEVNAPKNLQAVLLEDIGKKAEKEVLINRNSKWEITDVTLGKNKKYYKIKIKYVIQ